MAEENTVTMTVENVDRLFGEIVVNGESHVSENYVPPVQVEHTSPQSTVQEEEPSVPAPAQVVQGQDVYAVELNEVLHDFSDRDLTQSLADEVSARQQADGALQDSVSAIQNKIPSEATSTNKLADKAFVGTSIANAVNALDASSVGGNNKYIKAISETDGVISATEGSIDTAVTEDSPNPVTSNAVYDAIQESMGDSIKTYPTMTDLEQDLPNLEEGQIVATEEGDAFTTVDTVQSGVFNPVTSNAVAQKFSWTLVGEVYGGVSIPINFDNYDEVLIVSNMGYSRYGTVYCCSQVFPASYLKTHLGDYAWGFGGTLNGSTPYGYRAKVTVSSNSILPNQSLYDDGNHLNDTLFSVYAR